MSGCSGCWGLGAGRESNVAELTGMNYALKLVEFRVLGFRVAMVEG